MLAFWRLSDADAKLAWGDPFPAADYARLFDYTGAEMGLEQARFDRDRARELIARAPAEFRHPLPQQDAPWRAHT